MPSEDTKILEFNQYQNLIKRHLLNAYLECIIEKIDGCKNNPKTSTTTKVSEHIRSGFSSSFRSIENKYDVYIGKDCMKKFCESVKENTHEA